MKQRCIFIIGLILVLGLAVSPVRSDQPESAYTTIWKQISPSIVGIQADWNNLNFFGTGTVIQSDGLILTATSVVPPKGKNIRVRLPDGKEVPAEIVMADEDREVTLIKIAAGKPARPEQSERSGGMPALALGDSDEVKIGAPAYTLGNGLDSIMNDNQIALTVGVLSARYSLAKEGAYHLEEITSRYKDEVLETTAAVNGGIDGGPLISARGEVIGIIIFSYSKSRRLGIAIPANVIKPVIKEYLKPENIPVRNLPATPSFTEVVEKAAPRVVGIKVTYEERPPAPDPTPPPSEPGPPQPVSPAELLELKDYSARPDGLFSGVILDPAKGYVLTSYHNIAGKLKNIKVIRQTDTKKEELTAEILGWYEDLDVALLKVTGKLTGNPLELPDKLNLQVGDWTIVVGNNPDPSAVTPAIGIGIVSALERMPSGKTFQLSAQLNYANFGAPVFDIKGNFLGLAGEFTRPVEWGFNSGIGLTAKASVIKELLPDLKAGKKSPKTLVPFLGVQFARSTLDIKGVLVDQVLPGKAADKAGLKNNDIVIKFNNQPVNEWRELILAIRNCKVNDKVKITVQRGDKQVELEAVLGQRP